MRKARLKERQEAEEAKRALSAKSIELAQANQRSAEREQRIAEQEKRIQELESRLVRQENELKDLAQRRCVRGLLAAARSPRSPRSPATDSRPRISSSLNSAT